MSQHQLRVLQRWVIERRDIERRLRYLRRWSVLHIMARRLAVIQESPRGHPSGGKRDSLNYDSNDDSEYEGKGRVIDGKPFNIYSKPKHVHARERKAGWKRKAISDSIFRALKSTKQKSSRSNNNKNKRGWEYYWGVRDYHDYVEWDAY